MGRDRVGNCRCGNPGFCADAAPRTHRTVVDAVTFTPTDVLMHVADVGTGEPGTLTLLDAPRGVEEIVGCKVEACRRTWLISVGGRPFAERVGPATYRVVPPPRPPEATRPPRRKRRGRGRGMADA